MKKQIIVASAIAIAAVEGFGAAELRELTFQVAMPVREAPAIDGALDDACWKEAVVHDRYYEYIKPNPKRVATRTDCMIVYDEKGVYTGIRNWEKFPEKLRRNVTKNLQDNIWCDDCAELYYDPDASGAGYYRFVVNANGKYDPAWRMDAANIDWNWNPDGVKSAAKVFDDRWEFELFIPWTAFHNRPKPEPGNIWTFNHSRFRYAEKGWGDFSTSAPGGSVISPNKFGYLYFSDGRKPDAQAVLDLLQKRLQTIWAIEIDGKTYLRDLKGITTMDESVPEFIAKREAEEKKADEEYEKKLLAMADPATKAEKIALPVAGTYDLNPPKEYNGYNGWFRHNRIKDAYVTPHLDWRTGRAAKKPRVLFLTNFGWGFRDAVELEQRFDIDALFFPGNFGATGVYEDPVSLGTYLDKQRQFETLLAEEPDVFVLSTFRWNAIPARYRYEIVRRVRDEGRGLVLFGDRPGKLLDKQPKDLVAARMFATRVPNEAKDMPDFYLFGKGRIVCAPAYKLGAWSLAFRGTYETRAAQRMSPIFWAAKACEGASVTFAGGLDRETLSPEAEFLAFVTKGGDSGEVAWRVRNASAEIVRSGKAKLGEATAVPVKDLPPGDYALDILDTLPIARPFTRLAPVGAFTVGSTNEILIAENGPVVLKAQWEKPVAAPARLEWEICDMPYRQVRDRGVVKVGKFGREAVIRRPAGPFPTLAGFVRAKLVGEDGAVLAALDKMMFFPNHRFPDYTMTIWESLFDSGMLELLAPQCIDVLGYDNHLGERGSNSAVFNGRAVPYVTRVMLGGTTNGTTWANHVLPLPTGKTKEEKEYFANMRKDVNIYKPEVRAAIEKEFAERIKNTVKYGVSCWNLGDECHYSDDIGFGDAASEKLYREFLAKRYGTLERYNAAHGSSVKSFDEAPHKLVSVSKKEGDWPSLGDQKAYAAQMYSDTFQLLRGVIKKFDPKARVGAEGSVAGDLEQTIDQLEFWGPYRNLVLDEVVRNIAPDRVRGIWWGGYLSDPRNGFPVGQWEFLLTGTLNGDLWFAAMPGGTHSAFAGDYTLAPYVQKMHANHSQLKRGLASLLIRTPFAHQPFAFHYSHDSGIAATLSDEFPVPNEGLLTYFRFCYRYGYDINITTPKTLAKLKDKKILFLCGASSLSDAEVEAFRAFAKRGGQIVADCEPGVLDNFFARRATPPLKGLWTRLDRKWTDGEVQQLLAAKDIVPQAAVKGLDLGHTILRVREAGDMRLVGFKTLAKFVGRPVTLELGAKGAIYECDAGFVGEGDKVEIKALERPFKLYAVFPKRQSAPALKLDRTTIAPGDSVKFETAALRKGSVYRLTVKGPDGKEIRNREQVLAADGKSVSFQFPYSDRVGDYAVVLRDIATGLETTAAVEVK